MDDGPIVPELPAEPSEIRELEEDAAEEERRFHQLITLIEAQPEGFKVGYGDHGQVTIVRRFLNPAEPIAVKSIP